MRKYCGKRGAGSKQALDRFVAQGKNLLRRFQVLEINAADVLVARRSLLTRWHGNGRKIGAAAEMNHVLRDEEGEHTEDNEQP